MFRFYFDYWTQKKQTESGKEDSVASVVWQAKPEFQVLDFQRWTKILMLWIFYLPSMHLLMFHRILESDCTLVSRKIGSSEYIHMFTYIYIWYKQCITTRACACLATFLSVLQLTTRQSGKFIGIDNMLDLLTIWEISKSMQTLSGNFPNSRRYSRFPRSFQKTVSLKV